MQMTSFEKIGAKRKHRRFGNHCEDPWKRLKFKSGGIQSFCRSKDWTDAFKKV